MIRRAGCVRSGGLGAATLLAATLLFGAACGDDGSVKQGEGGADGSCKLRAATCEERTFSETIATIERASERSTEILADLTTACRLLAVDLGVPADAIAAGASASEQTGWCTLARDNLQMRGWTFTLAAPTCVYALSDQAACEARCSANAGCQGVLEDPSARCPNDIAGVCMACTDCKHDGEPCRGTCSGTCDGRCDGMASPGICAGQCDGCCSDSCAVAGPCDLCKSCPGPLGNPRCIGAASPPSAECADCTGCQALCAPLAAIGASCLAPLPCRSFGNMAILDATWRSYLRDIFSEYEEMRILTESLDVLVQASSTLEGSAHGDPNCIQPAAASMEKTIENATLASEVVASMASILDG